MAVFLSNYVFPTRYSLGTTQIQGAQTRLPTLILPCITPWYVDFFRWALSSNDVIFRPKAMLPFLLFAESLLKQPIKTIRDFKNRVENCLCLHYFYIFILLYFLKILMSDILYLLLDNYEK